MILFFPSLTQSQWFLSNKSQSALENVEKSFSPVCIFFSFDLQDNEEELKQPSNAATSSQTSRLKTKKEKKKNR